MGYVHKLRTESDLLPALEAVLAGKQFVSSNLVGWESTEGAAARVPHRHEILVCSDEAVFLEALLVLFRPDYGPAIHLLWLRRISFGFSLSGMEGGTPGC
jgi:hypothetical protein